MGWQKDRRRLAHVAEHVLECCAGSAEAVLRFYHDGLGLELVASFEDHAGFDGVMLALPDAAYHLEFTHKRGHHVGRAPSQDHLLVFYLPDSAAWQAAIERM